MALRRIRFLPTATLLALLTWPGFSAAEMLDEPACNALKNEQERLAAEGLKTEMLHGPDWAKANLPASRLEQIKQLMEVEEKIAFRCPLPPPPKPVAPAAASADGDQKAKTSKKRKKKDSGEAAATATAGDDAAPAPVKKKKQKAKKKEPVNDAYVPPPAMGNAFVDGEADPVPQPRQQSPKLAP